jgi:phosphoesterase RecJ-like protein
MATPPTIAEAASVISAATELAITGHVSPDGDALGSALALAHAARGAGKHAVVSFGSPFEIPASLSFLDTEPVVRPEEFPEAPDCMVVFDAGSIDRLAELGSAASAAGSVVVVDHHRSTSGEFGDVVVVDPEAGASAHLAMLLIDALGWEVTPATALCLLTGIVTDTGRFQYPSTNAEIMRSAARLLELGARPEVVGQHVYESVPFGYLALSAAVLGRAVLEEDLGLVWSSLSTDDLTAAGVGLGDADGLIDDLRIAREAGVAVLMKQVDAGWKVSLRSRGAVDVGSIAEAQGGGGHHNAAGFTATGEPEEVIELIRAGLRG